MTGTQLTQSEKQQRYRSRLSRQGLRPVQIWVPDTSAENFVEECQRQGRLLAASADHSELDEFIGAATDWAER